VDKVRTVRVGTIPTWKYGVYLLIIVVEVALVTTAVAFGIGAGRLFTGLLLGLASAPLLGLALRRMDSIDLTETGLIRRSPLRRRRIGWERVVGGRFAYDDGGRWTLALDLTPGSERNHELVLLSIPPVTGPVSNAYELRKREQVNEIRAVLRQRRIPITAVPQILAALQTHWGVTPPRRAQDCAQPDTAEPE